LLKDHIKYSYLAAYETVKNFVEKDENIEKTLKVAEELAEAYKRGNKSLIAGNGGSNCDAMHFAEEFTGRFRKDRKALPSLSISDSSHITCVGNDYGFNFIFAKGVEAFGKEGDFFFGISTSGNSQNIIEAVKMAKEKGVKVNEELDLMSQLQDYAIGLSEKVREEIKPTDAELESFFNTNKSRYNIPETADAKLIFITVKSTKEDDAVAKAEAEKLLAELTPENFSEKGKTLGNNQDIIYQDLGTFGTKAMVKEFEEALKDVPSNTVINKVIKTKFGYHLVYVKKNDNNQQWSAEHILIVPYPSDKTVAGKLEKLEKLKADIEAGTLALNDKIDEDVIQSFDAKGITPDGVIPDFVYSPEIAKAVFETPLNKVGIINPNKATIVVFQKTKEVKAEEANFTKLKEEVRKDYINKQVGEYMSKLF